MAIVTIPLRSDLPSYEFQTELDGETFGLVVRWNEREGAWIFDLLDGEGNMLRAGVKVVLDFPLLIRATNKSLPPGQLFAVDTGGGPLTDPALNDLGTRVQLVYYEASEFG